MAYDGGSTAAKQKVSAVITPAVQKKVTPKQEVKEDIASKIQTNTFFKVLFDPALNPDEKKKAIIAALTFTGTKEEMRVRLQEYYALEEYLQNVREQMAQEIIHITDTETMAELKKVYDEMNSSLLEFDDKMKPLTDIIDAIYKLRTEGKTLDVFKEIKEDRVRDAENETKKKDLNDKVESIRNKMRGLRDDTFQQGQQKSFFGFGGLKADAQRKIAENDNALNELQSQLEELATESKQLDESVANSGEYSVEKAKLRELLDISSEQHKERQEQLVNTALEYVKTAKERIGSVREHLNGLDKQFENLSDANGNMLGVYAILNEGVKGAESENIKVRDKLTVVPEGEDTIAKLTREQQKQAVEQHITAMDNAAVDTMSTFGDLTSQSIRIKTMKDANAQQIQMSRKMHSAGVAGVADRLSVVLQAISSAALGESSAMAKDNLAKMVDNTNQIAQKESIKVAMGINDTNQDLMKAIEDLGAWGEVTRTSSEIYSSGVKEMREKLDELTGLAKEVQKDVNDAIAINADTKQESVKSPDVKVSETSIGFNNPFGKIN